MYGFTRPPQFGSIPRVLPYPSPPLTFASSSASILEPHTADSATPPHKPAQSIYPNFSQTKDSSDQCIHQTLQHHEAALQAISNTLDTLIHSTDEKLDLILSLLSSSNNISKEESKATQIIKEWKSQLIPVTLSPLPDQAQPKVSGVDMTRTISDQSLLSNFSQVGSVYHDAEEGSLGNLAVEIEEKGWEALEEDRRVGNWRRLGLGPHANR
jgi:hypothetical protein